MSIIKEANAFATLRVEEPDFFIIPVAILLFFLLISLEHLIWTAAVRRHL